MQIVIHKCGSETYWYFSYVGHSFNVKGMDDMNFYVEGPAGWGKTRSYGVAREDATMITQ